MTKEEYIKELEGMEDPKLREEFAKQYHNDSMADKKVLLAKAQASLGMYEGLKAVADATTVSPLTYAFNESESGLRNLVDPNSPSNWMNMSTDALLKAAIKGGYVKDVPEFAPEWKKQEKREQFGKFLNMLARESTDQGRRNAVREYENTSLVKDPTGYAQKIINDFLFRTYTKRAKEQALKGEGASDWGQMSNQDLSTLGMDYGANVAFGAGAAGAGKLIAGQGLRSGANIVGSDLGAGLFGGAADVTNRAMNTDEGIRPYEVITEPLTAAATNALFTPGAVRQGISSGMSMMRGGKVGDVSRRNMMAKTADWLANKTGWDEAELARLFKEMGSNGDFATSPMSASTRKKIGEMKEIWDDGLHDSPGETYSLYDELQSLYEESARKPVFSETKDGVRTTLFSKDDLGLAPSKEDFMATLESKIADLKGALKNSAGAEEAPALKRKLKYFENARDMFGNNLMDPEDVLFKVDKPSPFKFERNPEFTPGNGTEFVLRDATADHDLKLMKEYTQKAKQGKIVDATGEMADELSRLKEKYPEFSRFVDNMHTVNNGRGMTVYENGVGSGLTEGNKYMYGGTFVPASNVLNAAFNPAKNGVKEAARNVGATGAEALLTGIAKPAVTFAGIERFNRPDNSMEALDARLKKIRDISENKNRAVEAALSWKYDPSIPEKDQLTAEERNIINQWRAKKLDEAMNGR